MKKPFCTTLLILSIILAGCGPIGGGASPADESGTIAALVLTRVAEWPTNTPMPSPTSTPVPPTFTATPPSPTSTVSTQISGTPTGTVYPYISWTPSGCDKSAFLADLDVVDYSFLYPGTNFTKTWRIRNIGTCTWTTKYRFTYISGNPMGADTIYLPRSVAPGDTIDLSLNMKAPDIDEDYSNFWRLRNAAGEIFGTTFYVAIEVSKSRATISPSATKTSTISAPTSTPSPTMTISPTNTSIPPSETPTLFPTEITPTE